MIEGEYERLTDEEKQNLNLIKRTLQKKIYRDIEKVKRGQVSEGKLD